MKIIQTKFLPESPQVPDKSNHGEKLNTPASLETLPVELLEMICVYLPVYSLAILTLTTKRLERKLGTEYRKDICADRPPQINDPHYFAAIGKDVEEDIQEDVNAGSEHEGGEDIEADMDEKHVARPHRIYENFMALLNKDLHDSIYCHFCTKLHSPTKAVPPSPDRWKWDPLDVGTRRPCVAVASERLTPRHIYYLQFAQVQSVMKHHRLGHNTVAALAHLSRTTVFKDYFTSLEDKHTWTTKTVAQIRNGHFLLRTEHTLEMPARPAPVLPRFCKFELCKHLTANQPKKAPTNGLRIDRAIRNIADHYNGGPNLYIFPKSKYPGFCPECCTEYEWTGCRLEDRKFYITATTWQDFGTGETPLEYIWNPQSLSGTRRVDSFPAVDLQFEPGSVRRAFETE